MFQPLLGRVLNWTTRSDLPVVPRLLSLALHCDIYSTDIGRAHFPHPYGIMIDRGVKIGDDVIIYHHVTIGRRHTGGPAPVIKDRACLFAGCTILGGVTIGEGAVVGPSAVVLDDVPSGGLAIAAKARVCVSSS